MISEKKVSYQTTKTYSTLNEFTDKTKNVWMVFHGMGYLSKYFINYFSELNADENYIIAPQAPSKYYQDKAFKHVGACWLTRENTSMEVENVLKFIDAIAEKEIKHNNANLIVLGYSQGVSIATRWVAQRKIQCQKLILHSGAIPNELQPGDFSFLKKYTTVDYIYGNKDPYINEARKTEERLKASKLFENRLKITVFDGAHEVNKEVILKFSQNN